MAIRERPPGPLRPAARRRSARASRTSSSTIPAVAEADCVSVYASRVTEPGTGPLLEALAARGVRVLLPVLGSGLQRDWAEYAGPDDLRERAPGRPPEPGGATLGAATLADADVVIAPALAVDTTGARLGQGGGWYDRALEHLRPGVPRRRPRVPRGALRRGDAPAAPRAARPPGRRRRHPAGVAPHHGVSVSRSRTSASVAACVNGQGNVSPRDHGAELVGVVHARRVPEVPVRVTHVDASRSPRSTTIRIDGAAVTANARARRPTPSRRRSTTRRRAPIGSAVDEVPDQRRTDRRRRARGARARPGAAAPTATSVASRPCAAVSSPARRDHRAGQHLVATLDHARRATCRPTTARRAPRSAGAPPRASASRRRVRSPSGRSSSKAD